MQGRGGVTIVREDLVDLDGQPMAGRGSPSPPPQARGLLRGCCGGGACPRLPPPPSRAADAAAARLAPQTLRASVSVDTQKDLVEGIQLAHGDVIVGLKTASADELVDMGREAERARLRHEQALREAEARERAAAALAAQADEGFQQLQARPPSRRRAPEPPPNLRPISAGPRPRARAQARLSAFSVDAAAQGLLRKGLSQQKEALQASLDRASGQLAESAALDAGRAQAVAALQQQLQVAEAAVEEALEQSRRAQEGGATQAR